MNLSEWMRQQKLTDEKMAERIGVTRSAVTHYRSGLRMPAPQIMLLIEAVTNEEVTARDMMKELQRVKKSISV